jgi:hypothetical protein
MIRLRLPARAARAAPTLLLALAAAGCSSPTPRLDAQFGDAVSLLNAQQQINPAAALNRDPVNGMDARAARSAYERYQKSFSAPEPQTNQFGIGLGGR